MNRKGKYVYKLKKMYTDADQQKIFLRHTWLRVSFLLVRKNWEIIASIV